jgi:hypothetical protein
VSDADLSLSIVQNAATPAQQYVGLEFTLDGLGLRGIPGLTFNIFDCRLLVNWASQGDRLDWSTATQDDAIHDEYGRLAPYTDLTKAVALEIQGWMDLDAYGFVMAYGGFTLFKGEIPTVNDDSYDAQAGTGIEPVAANLLSLSLQDGNMFAGTGGKFVRAVDEDPADGIDPPVTGFDYTSKAVGFYVSDADLSLSIVQNAATPAQQYVGLEFTLDGLGLRGIPGLTFT